MMKELQHPVTLAELARAVDGRVEGDKTLKICRAVHPDDAAGDTDLAVAMLPALLPNLEKGAATVALVHEAAPLPANIKAAIRVQKASRAMAALTTLFDRPRWQSFSTPGVHPSAVVDDSATISADAVVGPHCVIGAGATVGAGVCLIAQVTIGDGAILHDGVILHPGVRIGDDCEIGARTVIHSNTVIGADGFSYTAAGRGSVEAAKSGAAQVGQHSDSRAANTHLLRIGSLGRVVIGADCEIGACTTIDRATLRDTMIGDGTKIDNLVQVGHNAILGQNIMVCGQSGIAGSVQIGDRAVLGARSGLADNIRIGDDAIVMAASGVGGNVPPGTVVLGMPAAPREKMMAQFLSVARLPRELPKLAARVAELESKLVMLAEPVANAPEKS